MSKVKITQVLNDLHKLVEQYHLIDNPPKKKPVTVSYYYRKKAEALGVPVEEILANKKKYNGCDKKKTEEEKLQRVKFNNDRRFDRKRYEQYIYLKAKMAGLNPSEPIPRTRGQPKLNAMEIPEKMPDDFAEVLGLRKRGRPRIPDELKKPRYKPVLDENGNPVKKGRKTRLQVLERLEKLIQLGMNEKDEVAEVTVD